MNSFYSDALLRAWKARANQYFFGACALLLAGLLAGILLCTRVRTGNADTLLAAVIAVSTVTGWAALLMLYFGYAPAHARQKHIAGMLFCEEQAYTGEIYVQGEKIHIPKSIDIYKVALRDGEETVTFNIDAALLGRLPKNGSRVRICVSRRFITSCEVVV